MDPKSISHHDIRYLRDEEIPLSTKMAIENKRHVQEDYIQYIRKNMEMNQQAIPTFSSFYFMLNEWTQHFVFMMNKTGTPTKYKIFNYDNNECLVLFYDFIGRNMFSVSIKNELQEE